MNNTPFPDTEFIDKWAEFVEYRRVERKKPLTPNAITRWFNWFKKHNFTSAEAITCIDESLLCGWLRLVDKRTNNDRGTNNRTKSGSDGRSGSGRMSGTYNLFDDTAARFAERNDRDREGEI